MAVRSLRFLCPLDLYGSAKLEAKNILGLHFGLNRSGICVWNIAEGTVEPLLNKVDGALHRHLILDHTQYSIDEISKQLDAIATDQNAFGYVAGFPDHPYHRQNPSNGSHVKTHLSGLLDASKHLAERRYLSLISDRYSTADLDILARLANGSFARTEKRHVELKTKAAVVITRRFQRLAEGGAAFKVNNYWEYKNFWESQAFMRSIWAELGCFYDDPWASYLARKKKEWE